MKKNFQILCKGIALLTRAVQHEIVITFFVGGIYSILWAMNTLLFQCYFDSAEDALKGLSEGYVVLGWGICLIAYYLVAQALHGMYIYYYQKTERKAKGRIQHWFNKKVNEVEPICFEDKLFLDDLSKAQNGVEELPKTGLLFLSTILYYAIYFVAMGFYLFSISPMLLFIIGILIIPSLFGIIYRVKAYSDLEHVTTGFQRQARSYENALSNLEAQKENRVSNSIPFLSEHYKESLIRLSKIYMHVEQKANLHDVMLLAIGYIAHVLIIIILFFMLWKRRISVGTFAAIFTSLAIMTEKMNDMIIQSLGGVATGIGKVGNLIGFLSEEKHIEKTDIGDFTPAIEVKNISFAYPNTTRTVLKNISLKICANETVAIVGENGSGKTTLVKILMGLYKPNQGDVYISGSNTKDINLRSCRTKMTGVMQDFVRYKLSLQRNVQISAINLQGDVIDALERADIEYVANDIGIDTVLSREFGGIDLSGGQWQRIALARGLYKNGEIMLFDEPTAAIDPLEESKILEILEKETQNKTAVIITHRMGTTKFADRVIVMKNGEIVENGTHQQLIEKEGEYYHMFTAQSKWYQ